MYSTNINLSQGNDLTLMYIYEGKFTPNENNTIDVRFWPGKWFKKVVGRGNRISPEDMATREDLMMVLANMDLLLIR